MAMSNDDFFLDPSPQRAASAPSPAPAVNAPADHQHDPPDVPEPQLGTGPQLAPTTIHPSLLSLAENVGFTRAEAEEFGTPELLTSAVNAVLRRAKTHAGAPPVVPPPAAPPPPPEPVLEDIDIAAIEQDQMAHPEMIRMAKSMKALKLQNDKLMKHLEDVNEVNPHLLGDFNARREAEGNQVIDQVSQEMKLDPSILRDPKMQQRIGKRVMALRQTYAEEGEAPPDNRTMLRQVVAMLIPGTHSTVTPRTGEEVARS